jgi:hypothetical protein
MSYGAMFKGKDNNVCFSDQTPSIVFMGKAINTGVYGPDVRTRGGSYAYRYSTGWASYQFDNMYSQTVGGVPNQSYREINADGGSGGGTGYIDRIDQARKVTYSVESYEKPVIFTRYISPATMGGLVVKIIDNGSTGSRGWTNWNIEVWLFYSSPGQHVAAANSMEFYCFSKIPAGYTSTADVGLSIKDAVGDVMFHSDYAPAKIQEIMEITTGTNPAVDFSSTLLDSSGAVFSSMSKPAYLSQDWGRLVQTFGGGMSSFEYHQTPYSIRYVSGDDFIASFGNATLHQFAFSSASDSFIGAPNIVFPVIDGADYD